MLVQPYLNFDGRCEEAIKFYQGAVGAEVIMLMRFKDSPEPPPPDDHARGPRMRSITGDEASTSRAGPRTAGWERPAPLRGTADQAARMGRIDSALVANGSYA